MEKLTNLEHLRRSAAKSKELIGEVAKAAAEAIGELAGEVQERIPVKELTQAEYEALSEEEKQAATMYLLPDGGGGGGESETPAAGVLSFNGRRGDVVPRAGDYTADMVGADPAGSAQAALKAMLEAMKGVIPSGVIWIWNGAADAVPEGWALCDGANGTPNLRGRFVLGCSDGYAQGSVGGEAEHKLVTAEMPSHSHVQRVTTSPTSTSSASVTQYRRITGTQTSSAAYTYATGSTASASTGARTTVSTAASGSGTAHNNMPPYYALCYIMKL